MRADLPLLDFESAAEEAAAGAAESNTGHFQMVGGTLPDRVDTMAGEAVSSLQPVGGTWPVGGRPPDVDCPPPAEEESIPVVRVGDFPLLAAGLAVGVGMPFRTSIWSHVRPLAPTSLEENLLYRD